MKPEDKEVFAKTVLGFAELRGKSLSLAAVELYWQAMQGWELKDFSDAAAYLLGTSQFMPTPYDFEQLRKAGRPTSGEAWAKALDWVRSGNSNIPGTSFGDVGRRDCGDTQIDAAVRALGGYRAIAMSNEDQLPFLERRFAEHYETQVDRDGIRGELPNLLPRNTNGPVAIRFIGSK